MAEKRICSIDGCERPNYSFGWCRPHYQRWRRYGDPKIDSGRTPAGEPLRFFEEALLLETDDCILWPYAKGLSGHGRMKGMPSVLVHHNALVRRKGPPPEGKPFACHGPCHTPSCFNYRHLSWGSAADNVFDRLRDGTLLVGENHASAILSDADVDEIRRRYADGSVTQIALATEYRCHATHICKIINMKARIHAGS